MHIFLKSFFRKEDETLIKNSDSLKGYVFAN